MPEDANTSALRVVLDAELAEIARREDARLHRKVDSLSVAAIVAVAVVAGGLVWGLWAVPDVWESPTWVLWLVRGAAVFIAIFAALVMAAGAGTLFKDSREKTSQD